MHELPFHEKASFLTFTYDDEHLPENGNLPLRSGPKKKRDRPEHWQNFAKKLRYHCGPFRFLMCAEYGSEAHTERCHYHAIIFGHSFEEDREYLKANKQGQPLFTSPTLEKLWPHGFTTVGNVDFDSVSYVAGYIQKRIVGKKAKSHYRRTNKKTGEVFTQNPEFGTMSRNPGLGTKWIENYHQDVYPSDEVIINGQPTPPPSFYDRWYEKHYPDKWEEVKSKRKSKPTEDNSPARLAVKKKIFTSKHAAYQRK